MERRVVALAKGDGFQEVLVALDASADTEYPVVESIGGMGAWGVTVTMGDGWQVPDPVVALLCPQCPHSAHLIFPCCIHTVPTLSLWGVPAVSSYSSNGVL